MDALVLIDERPIFAVLCRATCVIGQVSEASHSPAFVACVLVC